MKRKLFCIVLAFLLLVPLFAYGASVQEEDTAAQASSNAEETERSSDIPVILVDDPYYVESEGIMKVYEYFYGEKEFEFEVLPQTAAEREARLSAIRAEIMAGEGPDAFILPANGSETWLSKAPLFPNIEKTMRTGVFLPLDDLIAESEHLKLEDHNEIVMAAGRTDEGRVVLPLLYYCDIFFLNKASVQNPEQSYETWDDLLNSEDQNVRDLLKSQMRLRFGHQYAKLADYEQDNLLITAEMLVEDMQRLNALSELPAYELGTKDLILVDSDFLDNQVLVWYSSRTNQYSNAEGMILPLKNENGGVTALISAYAAINRNSEHAEDVFRYIELYFNEDIQSMNGIDLGQIGPYGPHNWYGGLPDQAAIGSIHGGLMTHNRAYPEYLREYASVATAEIDSARFFTNLDVALAKAWMSNSTDYEKDAQEVIDEMKMMLAE